MTRMPKEQREFLEKLKNGYHHGDEARALQESLERRRMQAFVDQEGYKMDIGYAEYADYCRKGADGGDRS